jgi:hypothetical protein
MCEGCDFWVAKITGPQGFKLGKSSRWYAISVCMQESPGPRAFLVNKSLHLGVSKAFSLKKENVVWCGHIRCRCWSIAATSTSTPIVPVATPLRCYLIVASCLPVFSPSSRCSSSLAPPSVVQHIQFHALQPPATAIVSAPLHSSCYSQNISLLF